MWPTCTFKIKMAVMKTFPVSESPFCILDHLSTSDCVDVCSSEPGDLENMGVDVEIVALGHSSAEI